MELHIPAAPILMDLTVDGQRIPALIQNTKQGLIFALNRETGKPIWPIEERPVMQTQVPGNYTRPRNPTRPGRNRWTPSYGTGSPTSS